MLNSVFNLGRVVIIGSILLQFVPSFLEHREQLVKWIEESFLKHIGLVGVLKENEVYYYQLSISVNFNV